jgi:putative DNA primase/helicase
MTRPQWVLWKYEFRTDKWTKVPYQPKRPDAMAKADDPATWGMFDEAWQVYERMGFHGIGYEFCAGDPYFGVDVDNCLSDGELLPWAAPIIEMLRSTYGEISPSGHGVKFIGRGQLPEKTGTRRTGLGPEGTGALEVYDHGRYFTITGDLFGDSSDIAAMPDVAEKLYQMAKERPAQCNGCAREDPWLSTVSTGLDVEARAVAYLATIDPAVSGQGGHDKTLYAAVKVGPGFDLPADVAFRLLSDHYNPRCVPPWSEKELRHKVEDAYKVERARGWLLNSDPSRSEHPGGVGPPTSPGGCPEFAGDPKPIVVELLPVRGLDSRMIPLPLRSWLVDIANRGAFALEYPAAAAIVGLSGLIGRRIAIRPKRHDNWLVTPNLWGAAVGPPGIQKSPGIEEALRPLKRLAADAIEAHKDAMAAYLEQQMVAVSKRGAAKKKLEAEAKKGASDDALAELARTALAGDDASAPTARRYLINDATIEKLGELLEQNPNGLVVFRDELSGWLRTMDRQGHEGDRGFYLEAWNGNGSFTFDRIGRGTHHIPNVCLSIFGSIQPGPLARYLRRSISGEDADGFIPRFQLLFYPDAPPKFINVDRYPDTDAKNEAYAVFKALDRLDPVARRCEVDQDRGIPYLGFSTDAQDFFDAWRLELENRLRSGGLSNVMTCHLAKYRSLLPSLALIFHVTNTHVDDQLTPVNLDAVESAAAWCELLELHAHRIYHAGMEGDPDDAIRLAERIKQSRPNAFTIRDVQRKGWAGLSTNEDVRRAVGILEDRGWVKVVKIPSTETGGGPAEKVWIHPTLANRTKECERVDP